MQLQRVAGIRESKSEADDFRGPGSPPAARGRAGMSEREATCECRNGSRFLTFTGIYRQLYTANVWRVTRGQKRVEDARRRACDPRVHPSSPNFAKRDGLHRNSGQPELRTVMRRKSGKPDLRVITVYRGIGSYCGRSYGMIEHKKRIGWMLAAGAMGMAIGLSFVWTFAVFTATSWTAFPRFVVATVFLFLLPGWQIVRLCRLQLSTVECVTLSAVLGIVSTCFVYAVLAWLGVPSLLYWWIIAALIGLGWTWRSASMDIRDKFQTVGPAHLFLFLALIVSWIPMYVLPFYYKNLSLTGIGGLTFAPVLPDALFHTALASELTHAFPPQIPRAA